MILSILIPSIPQRLVSLHMLMHKYQNYIEKYELTGSVEIVSIVDNKMRSIGEKRQDLIRLANGRYFVISDDDDELLEIYFKVIREAIAKDVDVITYLQSAWINDEHSTVVFKHNNINEEFHKDKVTKRMAWYCCTWKKATVSNIDWFPINWGEDAAWAYKANEAAQTTHHIDEICHVYRHDSTKTAAFQ